MMASEGIVPGVITLTSGSQYSVISGFVGFMIIDRPVKILLIPSRN
jgi:hypothetical protein